MLHSQLYAYLIQVTVASVTVELRWLERAWSHESMYEMGEVRVGGCGSELQVGRHSGDVFSISCNLKVFCVFSLGSPHRGDSEEHTQYTIFNKKVTLHHPITVGAINVRAAEDLLHIHTNFKFATDT